MLRLSVMVVTIAAALTQISLAQLQKPAPEYKIRLGEARPPAPPVPAPGEKFWIDDEGDVNIETRGTDGRVVQQRITSRKKVDPEVLVYLSNVENRIVRYSYVVRNGARAKQSLHLFATGEEVGGR